MTISFHAHNYSNGISQQNTQSKKCECRASNCEHKNIRELVGLPRGYIITPSCNDAKGFNTTDLFDIQYKDGVTLSDGSKLLRPVILSLGKVDIKPTQNEKEYKVSLGGDNKRIMSEDELLSHKALSRGKITKTKEGLYNIDFVDTEGKKHHFVENKEGTLKVLRDNLLYM